MGNEESKSWIIYNRKRWVFGGNDDETEAYTRVYFKKIEKVDGDDDGAMLVDC